MGALVPPCSHCLRSAHSAWAGSHSWVCRALDIYLTRYLHLAYTLTSPLPPHLSTAASKHQIVLIPSFCIKTPAASEGAGRNMFAMCLLSDVRITQASWDARSLKGGLHPPCAPHAGLNVSRVPLATLYSTPRPELCTSTALPKHHFFRIQAPHAVIPLHFAGANDDDLPPNGVRYVGV